MPSKLDPHVVTIEYWLAAEPQLTALAILGRLIEKHPEQFGMKQHSIVQRLLKAQEEGCRRSLLRSRLALRRPLPHYSGYHGPDPPTVPAVERASIAERLNRLADVGSSVPTALSG